MRIPPELRNRICEYVVVSDLTFDIVEIAWLNSHVAAKFLREMKAALRQPSLTKTCKAIRGETLQIFYGQNTFKGSLLSRDLPNTACTLRWLVAIGEHRKLLMNFITEYYTSGESQGVCRSLGAVYDVGRVVDDQSDDYEVIKMIFPG